MDKIYTHILRESAAPLAETGLVGALLLLCVGFVFYSYRQHAKERDSYREDMKQLQDEHRAERTEWRRSQSEQAEYVMQEITRISAIVMHVKKD